MRLPNRRLNAKSRVVSIWQSVTAISFFALERPVITALSFLALPTSSYAPGLSGIGLGPGPTWPLDSLAKLALHNTPPLRPRVHVRASEWRMLSWHLAQP